MLSRKGLFGFRFCTLAPILVGASPLKVFPRLTEIRSSDQTIPLCRYSHLINPVGLENDCRNRMQAGGAALLVVSSRQGLAELMSGACGIKPFRDFCCVV